MKLGGRKNDGKDALVRILVPSPDGPQWFDFEGVDNRDVVFSTSLPPETGAFAQVEKKLVINPNALILAAFDDGSGNSE